MHITGVFFNPRVKSKPYSIVKKRNKKRKTISFPTEEMAIQARDAYVQEKNDERMAKQEALAPKRTADVARSGGNHDLERNV